MANETITLIVLGMHCSACVKRVERALKAVPGVHSVKVDLTRNLARIEVSAGAAGTAAASAADLSAAVRQIGFRVPEEGIAASPGA